MGFLALIAPFNNLLINPVKCIALFGFFLASQAAFLYPAYLLEFTGSNTIQDIFIGTLLFLITNACIFQVIK